MKITFLGSLLTFLFLTALLSIWLKNVNAFGVLNDSQTLTLKINTQKEIYLPGEVVELNFDLLNETNDIVKIISKPSVENGYLKVWISRDNKNYKEYRGDRWGLNDKGGSVNIEQGQTVTSQTTLLWNDKVQIEDRNKIYAKDRLEDSYVMPEPGTYYIKATAVIIGKEEKNKIESESIKINIEEPKDEDLEVWNKMKDNDNLAYFIQYGKVLDSSDKLQNRTDFEEEIQQIVIDYPNSSYTKHLQQNLVKFKAAEAKRREFLEKSKVNP